MAADREVIVVPSDEDSDPGYWSSGNDDDDSKHRPKRRRTELSASSSSSSSASVHVSSPRRSLEQLAEAQRAGRATKQRQRATDAAPSPVSPEIISTVKAGRLITDAALNILLPSVVISFVLEYAFEPPPKFIQFVAVHHDNVVLAVTAGRDGPTGEVAATVANRWLNRETSNRAGRIHQHPQPAMEVLIDGFNQSHKKKRKCDHKSFCRCAVHFSEQSDASLRYMVAKGVTHARGPAAASAAYVKETDILLPLEQSRYDDLTVGERRELAKAVVVTNSGPFSFAFHE